MASALDLLSAKISVSLSGVTSKSNQRLEKEASLCSRSEFTSVVKLKRQSLTIQILLIEPSFKACPTLENLPLSLKTYQGHRIKSINSLKNTLLNWSRSQKIKSSSNLSSNLKS